MKDFFPSTNSHIFSGRNVTLMITFIWLFSFGMVMLPLFEIWGKLGLNDTKQWCTVLPKDGHSPRIFYYFLAFGIPCIVIVVCYSAIFVKIIHIRKNLQGHSENTQGT